MVSALTLRTVIVQGKLKDILNFFGLLVETESHGKFKLLCRILTEINNKNILYGERYTSLFHIH